MCHAVACKRVSNCRGLDPVRDSEALQMLKVHKAASLRRTHADSDFLPKGKVDRAAETNLATS